MLVCYAVDMINGTVRAGVCGFTTRIAAGSEDDQHVTIRIETDCVKIRALADSLPVLDAYAEIQAGFDGELMKAVRANLKGCCAGCAVPSGIFKSMQAAASLALPQTASMEIKAE
jgi:hypothetical protein